MNNLTEIQSLIDAKRLDEALAALDELIAAEHEASDASLLIRGKLHWRMGNMRLAINDFSAAILINPDSPAKMLLDQANEILNFYNTDLYNP